MNLPLQSHLSQVLCIVWMCSSLQVNCEINNIKKQKKKYMWKVMKHFAKELTQIFITLTYFWSTSNNQLMLRINCNDAILFSARTQKMFVSFKSDHGQYNERHLSVLIKADMQLATLKLSCITSIYLVKMYHVVCKKPPNYHKQLPNRAVTAPDLAWIYCITYIYK